MSRTSAVKIWCGEFAAGPRISIPRIDDSVDRVEGDDALDIAGSGIGCEAIVCKTVLQRKNV